MASASRPHNMTPDVTFSFITVLPNIFRARN
jgi:hypothetical protein